MQYSQIYLVTLKAAYHSFTLRLKLTVIECVCIKSIDLVGATTGTSNKEALTVRWQLTYIERAMLKNVKDKIYIFKCYSDDQTFHITEDKTILQDSHKSQEKVNESKFFILEGFSFLHFLFYFLSSKCIEFTSAVSFLLRKRLSSLSPFLVPGLPASSGSQALSIHII